MNITTLNTTTLDGGVIIKKGGGGTPPSGGSDEWVFLDYTKIPKDTPWGAIILGMCYTTKLNMGGSIQIRPFNYFWLMGQDVNEMAKNVVAIAIGGGALMGSIEEGLNPIEIMFSSVPNLDDYRITKEQFYSLD